MKENLIHPISKKECKRNIDDLRIHLGLDEFRVIAYAEIWSEHETEELVAVSGHDSPTGTIELPEKPIFSPRVIGFPRDADAEYELLEEIARQFFIKREVPEATIRMGVEEKPCESCEDVIMDFRTMFPAPKVNLLITHL